VWANADKAPVPVRPTVCGLVPSLTPAGFTADGLMELEEGSCRYFKEGRTDTRWIKMKA